MAAKTSALDATRTTLRRAVKPDQKSTIGWMFFFEECGQKLDQNRAPTLDLQSPDRKGGVSEK